MKETASDDQSLTQCHILEEEICTEELNHELWFGMSVIVDNEIVCTYHSLSRRRDLIELLIADINSGAVSLRQLEFIMDDWLRSL